MTGFTLQPHPYRFLMGVPLKQEKPPQTGGFFHIWRRAKKERLKFVWGSGDGLFQV